MAWITIIFTHLPIRIALPFPRPEYRSPGPNLPVDEERPAATLRGGTLLHNGFYDLLAPQRNRKGDGVGISASADPPPDAVAGSRYDDIVDQIMPVPSTIPRPLSVYHPLARCHQRRQGVIVKTWDLNLRVLCTFTITTHSHLFSSTSPSHLVRTSDAGRAGALLTRLSPDGLGKLDVERSFSPECISLF